MKKKFLCFIIVVLIQFLFACCIHAENNDEVFRSPLVLSTEKTMEMVSGKSEKSNKTYMKMDAHLFSELKQKIKFKTVKSISHFPLYSDKMVTIINIQEVETFAEQTTIYHGNKRIKRNPNIVALKGEIAENGDSIFLTLSPRGAHGFTKDVYGESKRSLRYYPNSEYTLSYDTSEEDIRDLNLMNDMIEIPDELDSVSRQSPSVWGLDEMSYYRIAVDTTAKFLEYKFDGDTEAAEDFILSIFAYINPPFNDFNVHLYVNYIRLWPGGDDGYHSTGLRSLLSEFSSRWRNPANPEYSIPRHAAVILSLLRDGSAVGWGNVNVVCNKIGSASVYQGYGSMYINGMIIAHELGHVFGSGHTWLYDPPIEECTIMSYCNTEDNFVFHPRVIERFNSLHSPESDSCVPLTNPAESGCTAPEVSATGTSINSISLVWYNTGTAADYTVSYMPSGASGWTIAAEGLTHTNYVLSGLAESTTYTVRVQSFCSDGSELSDTVTAVTGTCTAPTVSVFDTFTDSITISWDDDGVNDYNILYRKEGASSWTTAATGFTGKSYRLSDLTDETTYNIRVYSNCPDGSQPFAEVTVSTDEIKNCIAPVVSVNGTSASTISISWNDAGGDRYDVICRESGASNWSTKAINYSFTSFEVKYLDKNTTYDIQVVSKCQDGSTINSSIISETTGELENSCNASELNITGTTENSVSLSWTDTGADSPVSYDLLYSIGSTGQWQTAAEGLTTTSYVINGLVENSNYWILLRSHCPGGSQPYDAVTAVTDESQVECTAPAANATGTTENSISLSWSNTDAADYTIKYKVSSASDWQTAATGLTATSYTLSGLTDNTTYNINIYSNCSDGSEPYDTVTETTDGSDVNCTAPVVNVTDTTASTLSLSWNDTGANSYTIYYRVSSTSWQNVSGLTTISYVLSGLTADTTYEIAVLAYCPDGSNPYEIITTETDDSGDPGLAIADVLGEYVRQIPANGWHTGIISNSGDTLKWTNEAGVSWTLIPDLENEQLLTTDDCPYPGKNFTLVLEQNSEGSVTVTGFNFLNELYSR